MAAHSVAALVRDGGSDLGRACGRVMERLPPGSGGMIAVDRNGKLVCRFNTKAMLRATADQTGAGFNTVVIDFQTYANSQTCCRLALTYLQQNSN